MEKNLSHNQGQYRAQLFEELVYRIIRNYLPKSNVFRNAYISSETGKSSGTYVDFLAFSEDKGVTLIETKAPYTGVSYPMLKRTVYNLNKFIQQMPESDKNLVQKIILAFASDLPQKFFHKDEYFSLIKDRTEIWDESKIKQLVKEYLSLELKSLSIEELELAVGINREKFIDSVITDEVSEELEKSGLDKELHLTSELVSGEFNNAIVICADFCSFSKFVSASGSDQQLKLSIMGRFYREVRKAIEENGAVFDKFMGDGVLFYWLPKPSSDLGKLYDLINGTISRLIGISMNLAEEWQDHIDAFIPIKGMRCGGAIGDLLLIPENPEGSTLLHAVGDCINLAARLQSSADPNSLVVSNRLKSNVFSQDENMDEMEPLELKNMGLIKAWKKTYSLGECQNIT